MSFLNRRQGMGWAALLLGGSIFLSRFMGLIRDKIISFLFGAGQESDLYFAAFVIPDFLNYLLAGGYFSITLIPLLSEHFERDQEDGWKLFSTVGTWIGVSAIGLTGIAMFLAPELSRLAAPGLDSASLARLSFFLRIILPAQVFFLLGSCITALLYLRRQFLAPALTPLVYNLSIIVCGVLLRDRGMEGFCWGVLVGALIGNLLLPLLAAIQGGIQYRPAFRHPALKRFAALALPLMIGQSVVVLDEQLVRIFGSIAGTGAISKLNYARRIMLVPVGVVAQAAGAASYPFLADLAARKDFSRFFQTLNSALKGVVTLLIPLTVWMIAVSEPTIRLVFQQGRFTAADAVESGRLLQILLPAITFWGIQQVIGRAFYANQDTVTPALLGTFATLISVPLYLLLATDYGSSGVALASTLSVVVYAGALSLVWTRKKGAAAFKGLFRDMSTSLLLSIASVLPAWPALSFTPLSPVAHPYISAIISICLSGMVFCVVFIALSCRFAPEPIRPLLSRTGAWGAWLLLRTERSRR